MSNQLFISSKSAKSAKTKLTLPLLSVCNFQGFLFLVFIYETILRKKKFKVTTLKKRERLYIFFVSYPSPIIRTHLRAWLTGLFC